MSKIRKAAMLQECQVRIPGVCSFNPETTVLAHLNGAGVAIKHHDFQGAFCCSKCHAVIDGHAKSDYPPVMIKLLHLEGIMRTQQILYCAGLITTRGSK
jgi:hypothetical protein